MIERKILIGLITSTEFLKKVKPIWNISLLESVTAKRLATWIWEYFDKYNEAPGKGIEAIYLSKVRDNKIPKDIAEEIEQDILPSLSKEFVKEGVDTQFLFDETEKYFNERHLRLLSQTIEGLVGEGKTEDAVELIRSFRPIAGPVISLNTFIKSVKQIRAEDKKPPTLLLSPWLRQGQLTIIYGNYGTGKSLLTLSIAYLLGLNKFDKEEHEIDSWQVKHNTGCLYIDGELGEFEMEDRVKQFEWLGPQHRDYRLKILSLPEYQLATEDSFYLVKRENQLKIIQWLKEHPSYKLVVLDSISTLFGLEDENSNSEWNAKVSRFLRDLRALDVAQLLLHHSGKDGKKGLRGASAMGAMAHNIFRLTNHGDKKQDEGEAHFTITKDKFRARGFSFKSFALHYIPDEITGQTSWEITSTNSNRK